MSLVAYCDADEVLAVAVNFRKDVIPATSGTLTEYQPNTNTISAQAVDDICIEASVRTRSLLRPHYDPAVIDAYDPTFPPTVNFLAKTIGAMIMYERYSAVLAPERDTAIIANLQNSYNQYLQEISGETLRDADGLDVPVTDATAALSGGNYQAFSAAALIPKGTAQYARD